jgi:glycosyltransferase involved in cell wall biosynthesis
MELTILIPTLPSRQEFFEDLFRELHSQILDAGKEHHIGIMWHQDETKTIGTKRNELLKMATAKYLCFFDDDDFPAPNYIKSIIEGMKTDADCLSLRGIMTTDGANPEFFEHSLRYSEWKTTSNGIKYERYPNHLNVIRASIAKQFAFPEVNIGEDHVWSTAVFKSGLLKTEFYTNETLYYYKYRTKK